MPRYLVIPREGTSVFSELSPSEMQEVVQEYHAWGMKLREEDALEAGEKLEDGGRVIRAAGDGISATDGPFTEAEEVIGGFWILRARDLDHATELVRDCPHLERGTLELRPIEELDV